MIHLESTRFGDIDIDESAAIHFPRGIIGFSDETRFAIIERENANIAYLQSLNTPRLALPIIDASFLKPEYPDAPREELAKTVGVNPESMAVLVVVHVNPEDKSLRANLLAPIVVDADARRAWQIILDPEKYGANVVIGAGKKNNAPTLANAANEHANKSIANAP